MAKSDKSDPQWPTVPKDYETLSNNEQLLLTRETSEELLRHIRNGPDGREHEVVPKDTVTAFLEMVSAVTENAVDQPSNTAILTALRSLEQPIKREEGDVTSLKHTTIDSSIPDPFCQTFNHTSPKRRRLLGPSSPLTSKSIKDSQPTTFPFQKLPPELRNKVYRYVFVSDRYIGATEQQRLAFMRAARRSFNLNFLLSCRQVHNEAAHIFYTANGFEFCTPATITQFLQGIGKQNRDRVTKLRYNCEGGIPRSEKRALEFMVDCKNLEEFDIRMIEEWVYVPQNTWHAFPILNALEVLRGSRKAEIGEPLFVVDGVDSPWEMNEYTPKSRPFLFANIQRKSIGRLAQFVRDLPIPFEHNVQNTARI